MPEKLLIDKLKSFLEEDIGFGDLTTELVIPPGTKIRAQIIVKENAVIAGLSELKMMFEKIVGAKFKQLVNEGDEVPPNTAVAELEGDGRTILSAERTALNIFSRMCGIATATRKFVKIIENAGLNVRIAATRKTAPGLRYFDKRAVMVGGGDPHRFRLDDQILIKDNHIAVIGSISEAVKRACISASFSKKIEVEAKTLNGAVEAAKSGADIIMLDNMSVKEAEETIEALKKLGLRDKVLIEVSGGINEENILDYARLNPDIVSIGEITHSVDSIDVSLEVIEVEK